MFYLAMASSVEVHSCPNEIIQIQDNVKDILVILFEDIMVSRHSCRILGCR